jgi:hypothetical protein
MSWWDHGEDVIGDGPADRLKEAWSRVLGARSRAGRPRPTLAEALEAFAHAMRTSGLDPRGQGLRLLGGPSGAVTFEGADGPEDLVREFSAAATRIEDEYRARFGRAPRRSELAKTLEFILGFETEQYVSDAAEWPMERVTFAAG